MADLVMIATAGEEERPGTRPREISDALQRFRPGHHRCIVLRRNDLETRAWPRRYADNSLGTAWLRVVRGGDTRWLGRVSSGEPFVVDGQRMPPFIEVPVTWVMSALSQLVSADDWPAYFPWYGGSPLAPLYSWRADAYAFRRLKGAPAAARRKRLRALRDELLDLDVERPRRHLAIAKAIAELRRVGHDLWSLDSDGEEEHWSGDYMRPAEGKGLWLRIRHSRFNWVDLSWHVDG